MRPGFRHGYRRLRQGTRAVAVRVAGQHGARHGWHVLREHDQLRARPRTPLRPALPSGSTRDAPSCGRDATVGACAPRMIIIKSSYDPTSANAGHAATAAPMMPWPRPWATFAARVRNNAQPEEPARQRGHPNTPPRRVQHDHRTRIDEPVHRERHQPPRPSCLTVRPYQRVRVLIRRHRSDGRDPDHRTRGRPPDDPVSRGHRAPPSSANSQVKRHELGFFGAVGPRTHFFQIRS